MVPSVVVKGEIFPQSRLCISRNLISLYVDLLIFNGSPKSLSEDIVEDSPPPIHADSDPFSYEDPREIIMAYGRSYSHLPNVKDRVISPPLGPR